MENQRTRFFIFLSGIFLLIGLEANTKISNTCLKHEFDLLMNYDGNHIYKNFSKKEGEDCTLYRDAYSSHLSWLKMTRECVSIPQIIHFIYLESKPLSKRVIQNIVSWKKFHPEWRFLFWTNRDDLNLGLEGVEFQKINEFDLGVLQPFFKQTGNNSEKSDLLRYAVLEKIGGICVDVYVRCFRPFDSLRQTLDFFSFLEIPQYIPGYDSAILVDNGLIGAAPHHPILLATIEKVVLNWKKMGRNVDGYDFGKGMNRTFAPFSSAVREGLTSKEKKNFVFPAGSIYPIHLLGAELEHAIQDGVCWGFHTSDATWMKIRDFNSLEERFSDLYEERVWGSIDHQFGSSGPGSNKSEAQPFIQFLQGFLSDHPNIHTVLDLGCGDWQIFSDFDWGARSYLGIDVVASVIHRNRDRYSSENIQFKQADIVESILPQADLLICKDVLMHLSIQNIQNLLRKFSDYPYVIFVNDIKNYTRIEVANSEIVDGDFRCLILKEPPFSIRATGASEYETRNSKKEIVWIEN